MGWLFKPVRSPASVKVRTGSPVIGCACCTLQYGDHVLEAPGEFFTREVHHIGWRAQARDSAPRIYSSSTIALITRLAGAAQFSTATGSSFSTARCVRSLSVG